LLKQSKRVQFPTGDGGEFDASVLHKLKKAGGRALGFMPDNGEGDAEVWRVEDMKLVEVPVENYGFFFSGDSYVIKYEYRNKRGGHGFVIYYWQGLQSSIDEKAASAIHAVRLDNELNGKAVQVSDELNRLKSMKLIFIQLLPISGPSRRRLRTSSLVEDLQGKTRRFQWRPSLRL